MEKIFSSPTTLFLSLLHVNKRLFDGNFFLKEEDRCDENVIQSLAYLRNFFSLKTDDAVIFLTAAIFTYLVHNEEPITLNLIADHYEVNAVRIWEFSQELLFLEKKGYLCKDTLIDSNSCASFFRVTEPVLRALELDSPLPLKELCAEKMNPSTADEDCLFLLQKEVDTKISQLTAEIGKIALDVDNFLASSKRRPSPTSPSSPKML